MIQFYRGESSTFNTVNPVLKSGQPGYELDTHKLKVGDGSTEYNDLPYIGGGGELDKERIVNLIYPIGSIYMSANDVNPSTLFGGTWEMFAKGRTIIGKDDTGTFSKLGVTGGSSTQSIEVNAHTHTIAHTHTVNSHTHTLSSHTHTVNAHAHNIVHSHKIGAHGHSIGGTAINASQMANHGHYFNGTQGWRDAVGVTSAGYSGTIYHKYLSVAYNDEGSLGITYSGDSATHSHSCSTTELITNNPTGITNSGNSSPGTGGPSTNNSGASSPATGGSSNANSGSAGAQTISVNVIQPYIVVNIWKRTA